MVFPHTFRTEHTETRTTSSMYGHFYESRKHVRVPLEPDTVELLKLVDDSRSEYIEDLREAIAIPSVSGVFKHRIDVTNMIKLVESWFFKLKVKYEAYDNGWEKIDGLCVKRPVVLLGHLGKSGTKKTICLYFHLDVTSPEEQTWRTDPWTLTQVEKSIFGKGVAFGKGPMICWFHAIGAYQKKKMPLPVNIKFIVESMHEYKSEGLEEVLKNTKSTFLTNIDSIILNQSEWLGEKYPCLSYGTTGTCRFEITVEKNNDSNPKEDIQEIFKNIVDANGKILISGFSKFVESITPAEEKLYDSIDFDFESLRITLPENKQHWDKVQMLMSFWRLPSIVVGPDVFCECEGEKKESAIKRMFTIKVVPKLTPDMVGGLVTDHVFNICKEMNCQSKVDCEMIYGVRPWLVDFRNSEYEAARRATIQIYKEEPNMIREDQEIPILLMLRQVIEREVVLLPLSTSSCNARGGDENISTRNFFEGTKLLIAFLKQLAHTRN